MRFQLITATLLCWLFLATQSYAHDPTHHTHRFTRGTVQSVDTTGFELKSDAAPLKVQVTSSTIFELGDGTSVGRGVAIGDNVAVEGTKLESGEMMATTIQVERASSADGASGKREGAQ